MGEVYLPGMSFETSRQEKPGCFASIHFLSAVKSPSSVTSCVALDVLGGISTGEESSVEGWCTSSVSSSPSS